MNFADVGCRFFHHTDSLTLRRIRIKDLRMLCLGYTEVEIAVKLCQTTVGPHRDDMLFSVDGVDIRKYGSQGQQRTSALSLKLSEISLVKKNINSTPVLLLDDVLSELDGNRQNYLLNSLSDTQTIITCTGLDEFVKNRFQVDKVFHVVKGQVEVIDE